MYPTNPLKLKKNNYIWINNNNKKNNNNNNNNYNYFYNMNYLYILPIYFKSDIHDKWEAAIQGLTFRLEIIIVIIEYHSSVKIL